MAYPFCRQGYGGGGYGGGGYGEGYGGGAYYGGGGYGQGYGGGGFVGVRLRREYDEPRRGYPSYSNRSGLGGMGNPFTGMGDRMGGTMSGARRLVNAGLDTVGGWGQAMDDRFDRSNFKRGVGRMGQRVANGFAGLRPGGGGRHRTDWGHTAGGSWRYA